MRPSPPIVILLIVGLAMLLLALKRYDSEKAVRDARCAVRTAVVAHLEQELGNHMELQFDPKGWPHGTGPHVFSNDRLRPQSASLFEDAKWSNPVELCPRLKAFLKREGIRYSNGSRVEFAGAKPGSTLPQKPVWLWDTRVFVEQGKAILFVSIGLKPGFLKDTAVYLQRDPSGAWHAQSLPGVNR